MSLTLETRPRFRLFPNDSALGRLFHLPVPLLSGAADEAFLTGAHFTGSRGGFTLFERDGWSGGVAVLSLRSLAELEPQTLRLYVQLIELARGRHLSRIWNYVPAINDTGAGGLENYRLFCRARATAFEAAFGRDYSSRLPAASAVGHADLDLVIAFVTSECAPRHVENPRQIPAYQYPPEYGPKSPSFSRATIVPGSQGTTVFISGTASIQGHATVAPTDTEAQTRNTLENLAEISHACGLGRDLSRHHASRRSFKVYLRHGADLTAVAGQLERALLRPDDVVSYLRADICRRELNVEIEATIVNE